MSNYQSRKWLLTINNPLDYQLTHDVLIKLLNKFMPRYYCLCDEIGLKENTFHTHIFLYSESPIRFSTLKNRFPIAHIDKAYGSCINNRDYIKKDGKWADSNKSSTNIEDSFYEFGQIPEEKNEKYPEFTELLEEISMGKTNLEIVRNNPKLSFKIKDIEILRQTYNLETNGRLMRDVEVTYIYGATGVGKTSYVYNNFPIKDIYRITNYRHGSVLFDNYNGEDVLVFEEFDSQIPISEMLTYLDRYPLKLPARYSDKIANYTKVFILSNLDLSKQYSQYSLHNNFEIWLAFLRRIKNVIEIKSNNEINIKSKEEYKYVR